MKIHHWFIPSKMNKFHPHALRSTGLIVFLIIFLTIPPLYNITTTGHVKVLGYATDVNINDIYNLSNQERAKAGQGPLTLNAQLNSAALSKANDMIADNYWAHVAPDGTTPWAFIIGSGYQYSVAGENLAMDFNLSSGVVAGWMASPLHRDNVLNPSFRDVGYAVINGVLQGEETTLVVAEYGAINEPIIASTTPAPAKPETTPAISPTISTQSNNQVTTAAPVNASPQANQDIIKGITSSLPMKAYNSLNWGQKASILVACTLILLFIVKHTVIWRERKRGTRHVLLRAHPLGQAAILITFVLTTIFSGIGVVL